MDEGSGRRGQQRVRRKLSAPPPLLPSAADDVTCGGALRRCDVCGCVVPQAPGSWGQHVTGIKHRRNAARARVHGSNGGPLVVSVFEDTTAAPNPRYMSRDPLLVALRAPAQAHSGAAAAAEAAAAAGALARLRRRLLLEALSHAGVGAAYQVLTRRFVPEVLADAWARVLATARAQAVHERRTRRRGDGGGGLGGGNDGGGAESARRLGWRPAAESGWERRSPQGTAERPSGGAEGAGRLLAAQRADNMAPAPPPAPIQLSHLAAGGSGDDASNGCSAGGGWGAAEVAALAGLLDGGGLAVGSVSLTVPCPTHGPHAAALTTALSVLARSLARQPGLARFELHAACGAGYARAMRQGGARVAAALAPQWGHVLAALRGAAGLLPSLRWLSLEAPPGVLPPEPLARLQAALSAAPGAMRAVVLAGTHTRVGRDSLLRRLPADVLARVLDIAAPRTPCELILKLIEPLDPMGSSSSSSSGSDDSSGSSSSSSSSSSDESSSGNEGESDGDGSDGGPAGEAD